MGSYEAGQVGLPQSSVSQITSLVFDSLSSSLALLHSDSSLSLYPCFSPLSSLSSSLSFPQTFISGPTSSAAFLPVLNPTHRRLLFLVVSPSHSAASILLRFWILKNYNNCFARAHVECNNRLLSYDNARSGVVFNVCHGASVKLVAMSNVFVMYCVSSKMAYVFAVRMVGGDGDDSVKLIKTGVVECCLPVFSVGVSSRFLVLGEFDGVRVFSMQSLVKGRVKKTSAGRLLSLNNGGHGGLEGKIDKHSASTKLSSARLRQDSKEGGACFVSFKGNGDSFSSSELQMKAIKAINIEALSPNEFLIMDSARRIHHLCLSNFVLGSEVSCHMNQLSLSIKVQKMAVLPGAQTFWISDGQYTVHTILLPDPDTSINGGDRKDDDKKLIQISVTSAIFSSETVQQLVPSAANAILILGQGNIFAYTIS